MICNYCPAEFGDIVIEIYQIFRLLARLHIVEMNVLVTPLEVVNDSLICQLLLYYEDVLEELYDPLLDIKMIEFRNHSLLIFQVLFIRINQSISLINHTSNIIED